MFPPQTNGIENVLDNINTSVKLELPGVGENVQEHVFVAMSWGTVLISIHETLIDGQFSQS